MGDTGPQENSWLGATEKSSFANRLQIQGPPPFKVNLTVARLCWYKVRICTAHQDLIQPVSWLPADFARQLSEELSVLPQSGNCLPGGSFLSLGCHTPQVVRAYIIM